MPSRRGFTLIEIAVVIAIVGLILMLGALRMDWLTPDRALLTGARTLRAALEGMHDAVLLRGEPADLVYDLTQGSCRLEFPSSGPPPEVLMETRLPEGVVFRRILLRGVQERTQGEVRLRLSAGGSGPPHAPVLGLPSGGKGVQTLRVHPLSGAVTVHPEEKAFTDLFTFMPDEREPPTP